MKYRNYTLKNKHMDIKEIKIEVKKAQEIIKQCKTSMKTLFETEMIALFKENPTVENISMGVNNHEWNDGDATTFDIYYEDLSLEFKDDTTYDPCNEGDTDKDDEKIRESFVELMGLFDVESFYEQHYGEAYESFTLSVKNDKLKAE